MHCRTQPEPPACAQQDIHLRSVFNSLPILMVVADATGTPVMMNKAFEDLTGYALLDIPNKAILREKWQIRSDADRDRENPTVWQESLLCTKANQCIEILHASIRLHDGFCVDIGLDNRNCQRANMDLLEYTARLKDQTELIDLSHDSIIIHDLDGRITFWNQGAEQLYGWKREEVLGKITHEVLGTQFCEPLIKIIAAVSSIGRWEGELINRSKTGESLTIESRWALRKSHDGTPLAILEIDRDITRRKEDEQIAREALEYAESIIQTVSEALVVLTADLKVASANERFYRMFGFTAEETVNRPFMTLGSHQWDVPELKRLLLRILPQNSTIEEYVMEYSSFHTGRKTLHLNARQVSNEHGKAGLILLAIQDITTRKRQEEMLKEMTEQLLLSEEVQRQQIATTLHDTIGQVLAFCKRELTAMEKHSSGSLQQSLHKVIESMNNVIEQSRKLTMDLSSPTLHTFGLEAGIEEMADRFRESFGIGCRFICSDEPKPLEKKVQLLLYRSVKELLLNAAKHASAGQVTIQIQRQNRFFCVRVEDDGRGFDTASLHEIVLAEKGFGLYSISQRLKNIGGSFKIVSKVGKGTIVTLEAPLLVEGRQGEKNGH